jgi:hypothetical protein
MPLRDLNAQLPVRMEMSAFQPFCFAYARHQERQNKVKSISSRIKMKKATW